MHEKSIAGHVLLPLGLSFPLGHAHGGWVYPKEGVLCSLQRLLQTEVECEQWVPLNLYPADLPTSHPTQPSHRLLAVIPLLQIWDHQTEDQEHWASSSTAGCWAAARWLHKAPSPHCCCLTGSSCIPCFILTLRFTMTVSGHD